MSERDVIVACDFAGRSQLLDFLDKLGDCRPYLKVGMELFYATGPTLVRELKDQGFRIFLDLKLHDIPTTVEKSMRVLAGLGVDIVNVHAAGGTKMIQAAIRGLTLENGERLTKLLAVTQLTSTSREMLADELLIPRPLDEVVASYAKLSQLGGADGVVCSPREANLVKQACGTSFLTVTPGIRFKTNPQTAGASLLQAADDQVRIATPGLARQLGADFIVVGRPITTAPDPAAAYRRCQKEFSDAGEDG